MHNQKVNTRSHGSISSRLIRRILMTSRTVFIHSHHQIKNPVQVLKVIKQCIRVRWSRRCHSRACAALWVFLRAYCRVTLRCEPRMRSAMSLPQSLYCRVTLRCEPRMRSNDNHHMSLVAEYVRACKYVHVCVCVGVCVEGCVLDLWGRSWESCRVMCVHVCVCVCVEDSCLSWTSFAFVNII